MKKTVVVYSSKYGSTKKYAEWIAKDLSCDLYDKKDMTPNKLEQYDTIIYGGGLYAGGVNGIQLITKSFHQIKNKNIIVFTCGLADTEDEHNMQSVKKSLHKRFSPEMQKKIQVFHLRGAIDYSKLSAAHKIMMSMLFKMITKKDSNTLTSENKEFLTTYGKTVDFTNEDNIIPILTYIKDL